MQKRNNLILSIISLLTWISLINLVKQDKSNKFFKEDQIGTIDTLKKSSFARGMFLDIGVLSSIISFWIFKSSKSKLRIPFVIATIFVGSFAALPYFTMYFFVKAVTKKGKL